MVRLRLIIAPQDKTVGPAKLMPPAGARNNRKATVKMRINTAPEFIRLDPNNFYLFMLL